MYIKFLFVYLICHCRVFNSDFFRTLFSLNFPAMRALLFCLLSYSFKPHRHNNGINLGNEEETVR